MKRVFLIVLAVLMVSALPASVTTITDPSSPTGYTTVFRYVDEDATDVKLTGSFQFYVNGDMHVFANGFLLSASDSLSNYMVAPEDWTAELDLRHANDEGYTAAMTKTADGWVRTLQLPCASYTYFFRVSYDGGETWTVVTDPDNIPPQNAYSMNPQYRSQFFVPYDGTRQNPADNWTWLMPIEDENLRGNVSYREYEGADGEARPMQIYTPATYDADRPEPYKVVYLQHGSGGYEGDWFHQGNIANIADRIIASGKNEPFLIVSLENNGLMDKTNTPVIEKVRADLIECAVPYIEAHYNVVKGPEGRSYCGLSRGARTASMMLMNYPQDFGYYALLSGGQTNKYSPDMDAEAMKEPELYIAAGFIDAFMLMRHSINTPGDATTVSFAWLMDKLGVPYNKGGSLLLVPGAHDWFVWPQLAKDYFENYLWK